MSTATGEVERADPQAPGASLLFISSRQRNLVLALLLVVVTLLLYNRANHFAFINYDDCLAVYENAHVRDGLTWSTLKWAMTATDLANWQPLTWMSHALDCQLFHLNPAGHHFTSIVLHCLNVVLLFGLLVLGTRRIAPSFLVAALFALHPLNVESVVWIAERKNVLSTMFFFLTLGAYGGYACKPGWKRYLAVFWLLACGLASKPMLVTTPFVLLLLDYWPLGRIANWSEPSNALPVQQRSIFSLVIEKLPLLGLVVASCVITAVVQRTGGALGTASYPLGDRLKNAIWSYVTYLFKLAWPSHLALFYPFAGHALAMWKIVPAALFLLAATYAVWRFRRPGYLLTGWLWFLGTLVPVIGIIQAGTQSMADRYAYVPLIGIFVMFAWVATDWYAADEFAVYATKKTELQWASFVVPVLVLAPLSLVTYTQIGYWRDSLTVWSHTLKVTSNNSVAEDNMGEALVQLHRVDDAYPFFLKAAADAPGDPVARLNIGAYLQMHGRGDDAIAEYELALRAGAEPAMRSIAYANLGALYFDRGDYAKSESSYEQALRLSPDRVSALRGMALASEKQGQWEQATRYLAYVAHLETSGRAYMELAESLARADHPAEAKLAWQKAVRLDPNLANVHSSSMVTRP